jgi:hypothetical protein
VRKKDWTEIDVDFGTEGLKCYDSDPNNTQVGEAFTWAMRKTQFYDCIYLVGKSIAQHLICLVQYKVTETGK